MARTRQLGARQAICPLTACAACGFAVVGRDNNRRRRIALRVNGPSRACEAHASSTRSLGNRGQCALPPYSMQGPTARRRCYSAGRFKVKDSRV